MPTADLHKFSFREGVYFISEPRAYQHPEEAYDRQYGNDRIELETYRTEGMALLELCGEYGIPDSGPVLEIGCGTGRLSLSLVLSGGLTEILITDASPVFCSITSQKLASLDAPTPKTSMAVLLSEDLDRLLPESYALVIMRSVLHHVADIPKFLRDCARILVPGGLLLCEEPCQEGYLLMGAMTLMVPDLLQAKGIVLSSEQMHRVREFVDTMQFYARRDVDKSSAEDKHLFRPDELMRLGNLSHMEMHCFANRTFGDIRKRNETLPSNYFEAFYFNYLKYCMSWDDELLQVFSEHVRKYWDYFSCLAFQNALPYTYSTFLWRKLA